MALQDNTCADRTIIVEMDEKQQGEGEAQRRHRKNAFDCAYQTQYVSGQKK